MELTNEQRMTVKQWVADGADLSAVQRRIKEEFGISMTFMDARLLVLELGAQLKDKPEPRKPVPPKPEAEDDLDAETPDEVGKAGAIPKGASDGVIGGSVSVTLDRVVQAGAVASGQVTFSDGTRAKWIFDQMGRLGLDGVKPGYRPPQEDVREFQKQLQSLLQTRGY